MCICPHSCPSGPTGPPGRRLRTGLGLSPSIPVISKRQNLAFPGGGRYTRDRKARGGVGRRSDGRCRLTQRDWRFDGVLDIRDDAMAKQVIPDQDAVQRLMTDAAEYQLAALNAGLGFWTGWVKETAAYSKTAERSLARLRTNPDNSNKILIELADAQAEHLRAVTELPRQAANLFVAELDRLRHVEATRTRSTRSKAPARRSVRAKG